MKIKVRDLRKLIKEATGVIPQEGGDSLDTQVDRLYLKYVKPSQGVQEGLQSLFEKDDDEQSKETKKGLDDIDVESFANKVSSLIANPTNLLEFRNTLLRRAVTFLKKNFDQDVIDSFESIMEENHSTVDGETERETKVSNFVPPRAAQAGPGA